MADLSQFEPGLWWLQLLSWAAFLALAFLLLEQAADRVMRFLDNLRRWREGAGWDEE